VIAAVNRCATQNQAQQRVFQQSVKAGFLQIGDKAGDRSGEPLRHPKSSATPNFSAICQSRLPTDRG
jgi:hypothetical protein